MHNQPADAEIHLDNMTYTIHSNSRVDPQEVIESLVRAAGIDKYCQLTMQSNGQPIAQRRVIVHDGHTPRDFSEADMPAGREYFTIEYQVCSRPWFDGHKTEEEKRLPNTFKVTGQVITPNIAGEVQKQLSNKNTTSQ